MDEKPVAESVTYTSRVMMPDDANPSGNVHGGVIMKEIDNAAGVAAARHARNRIVTASIDRLDFHNPCYVGELLMLKASVNLTGRTSMEVGARADAENVRTGEVRHIASAYLTFVALDKEGKPTTIPKTVPETDEEKRRHEAAKVRRERRLKACGKNC